jgi:cold shock CspA family protein
MTIGRKTISGTGTVGFLNPDNGYGMIRPDDGSENLYVSLEPLHAGSIARARRVQYKLHVPEIGAPWLADLRAI